jgi:hypothetical protein
MLVKSVVMKICRERDRKYDFTSLTPAIAASRYEYLLLLLKVYKQTNNDTK